MHAELQHCKVKRADITNEKTMFVLDFVDYRVSLSFLCGVRAEA
jgi:hypothetical protein